MGRHCFGGSARYTTSWTTICRAWRWRLRRTLQPGRNTQEKLDSPLLLEKNSDDSRRAVFGECPVRKTGLTWREIPLLVDRFSWARCTSSVVESCDSSHGWCTASLNAARRRHAPDGDRHCQTIHKQHFLDCFAEGCLTGKMICPL